MPDVVIWLISGTKRIASFRIPAYEVLFSPQSDACGQYCGKVFNMFMKVMWRWYMLALYVLQKLFCWYKTSVAGGLQR